MKTTSKQSLGGQTTAKMLRTAALGKYYENPSICKNCNSVIHPKDGQKLRQVRVKVFCSKSCAAIFNNSAYPKRAREKNLLHLPTTTEVSSSNATMEGKRLIQLLRTKGEVFSERANWQSARSHIQKIARSTYKKSSRPKCCYICKYDRHYEVCHISSVASFPNTATLGEINSIDNLVALCPTHHWEFDKKILSIGSEPKN